MALVVCTAWQASTQRPQRTHLTISRTSAGLLISFGTGFQTGSKMLPRILYSAARVCSSHLPFFSQCRQSCGWLAKISSRMVLRALRTFGELVVMSPASSTRLLQAVFSLLLWLSSTRQTRQNARTPRSGWWQREGILMPIFRAASIMVVPDGTVTGIPSILIVTILLGSICILVTILSAI